VENAAYDQTLPIPRNATTSCGLDYLAWGHFHSKALYADEAGAFRMAYSGTHEPTAFAAHASGKALIVEIPHRGAAPQIRAIRTGTLEWLSYRRKIEQPGEIAALAVDNLPAPEHTLVDCALDG
jgi:DNA repair exonuclease SbcCD nuclease subunit